MEGEIYGFSGAKLAGRNAPSDALRVTLRPDKAAG